MVVVAFAGLARGGKTTCARMFKTWCDKHGLDATICSFAEPMKAAARRIGLSKDNNPTKYREVLQRWGENKRNPNHQPGRSGPNYWVNRMRTHLLNTAAAEKSGYYKLWSYQNENRFKEKVVIFDDLRYLNELDLVMDFKGTAVFVDGASRLKDLDAEWRKHESEALATLYTCGALPDELFDFYITNTSSEKDLAKLVQKLAPIWVDLETVV